MIVCSMYSIRKDARVKSDVYRKEVDSVSCIMYREVHGNRKKGGIGIGGDAQQYYLCHPRLVLRGI